MANRSPFLSYIEEFMYASHYAKSTVVAYLSWIKQYILFHGKQHPEKLGQAEVEEFLTWLAVKKNVAVRT